MQGLFDHGHLSKNQRVLIHGGAGGVGAFAVQLARLHGAHVIATTSSTRVRLAHDLGVDEVINHATTDFTDIDHVDLVFDTAGGTRLKRSVEVVGEGARIVSVAEPPPVEECERRGIDAIFFLVQPNQDQLQHLAGLADRGSLRVVVDRTYPLAEARDAFAYTMERGGSGKVVLTMGANG